MEKIKELQIWALDSIGLQVAEIQKKLDDLAKMTNPFEIESTMYYVSHISEKLRNYSSEMHQSMHFVNSQAIDAGTSFNKN